jgi:thioredoxin 1
MKNTTYLTILLGIFLSFSTFNTLMAQKKTSKYNTLKKAKQINFIENNWELTLKKAQAEHKYIFVDAYAVWCGPCKLLKTTTFKNHQVADFYNKNFVNISIDMEKGNGIKLAEKWGVEAYPTLLILDSNGNLVVGNTGYVDAKELLEFGKKALVKDKS